MRELAGEGMLLLGLQWHFNGNSTALQWRFNGTSTELQWHKKPFLGVADVDIFCMVFHKL